MKAILLAFFLCAMSSSFDGMSQEPELGIVRAAQVALDDYSRRLKTESKEEWEYTAYVTNLANYSVGLSVSRDSYVVVIRLNKTDVRIHGGGGTYYVEKSTYKIIRFVGEE